MPILDTQVLFAAADDTDRFHEDAKLHLSRLSTRTLLGTFALAEFDIVLKSYGYSASQRSEELLLLIRDYPSVASRVHQVFPSTFVLASRIEDSLDLDYFDSLIAAESVEHDGTVVSSDREFDRVLGLTRISLV
jgi:predicted nucleic acid-binding protein